MQRIIGQPETGDVLMPDVGETPATISILGATGSVGTSTLDVITAAPPGRFDVVALTANENWRDLATAARRHNAAIAAIANPAHYQDLKDALSDTEIAVAAGPGGLDEAVDRDVDCVMAAIVGAAGLGPTMTAARRASRLAIANKECFVIAGELFLAELAAHGTEIIPVDSEHAAIYQVAVGRDPDTIEKVVLTASGGAFRDWPAARLSQATREDALKHPCWDMGAKVTVDSATMMNKGLELIEAHHLFALDEARLDAVIHPQSLVHCLVEFCDGSLIAQFAAPDMRTPIAQSLFWPNRRNTPNGRFDYKRLAGLDFSPVDPDRYPAFTVARAALRRGGAAPAILNGANEEAVGAFLDGRIHFLDIATTVAETLERADRDGLVRAPGSIAEALEADRAARHLARDVMGAM